MTDPYQLPADLPIPTDDGAADHLVGLPLPAVRLSDTNGHTVDLNTIGAQRRRAVVYLYPLTGRPERDLPAGWDAIPGARGCTTEACDFRDHHTELLGTGVTAVFGLSSQDSEYQHELVDRLRLPFPMLSDPDLRLATELNLPTFTAEGRRLYTRLTMVIRNGSIEHVFYPIFPPNQHARQVLSWLTAHPE